MDEGRAQDAGTWLDRQLARRLPRFSSRLRDLLGFLLVIGLVQAVFWGLYGSPLWPKPSSEPVDHVSFTRTTLAHLPKPTPLAAGQARYEPIQLPHTECCEPAYLALKLTFDLPEVPAAGLGLAAYQQVDNFIILINGSIIFQRGEMTFPNQAFEAQQPVVDRIPAGLLRTGSNELVFITVRQGLPYTDLASPLLGPWAEVRQWAEVRLWRFTDYRLLSGWTTFLVGLFAALLAFRSQQRRFALWLAALCGAWSAYALYGLWLDPPFGGLVRVWLFFAVNSLVAVALVGLIDAWTDQPLPRLQPALVAVFLAFITACALWPALRPMPEAYDGPALVWSWLSAALGAAAAARLVWHFATRKEPRRLEAALLTICALCVVLDALGEHFGLNAGGFLVDSAPILLLALAVAFVQRNFTLFKSSVSLNALLAGRLAERESELAVAHARERDMVRRQAHDDERRRIMRDMHDGLGSQLMSLLLAARRGAVDNERVAEGLQSVVDEMRLMVDSMDSVGESLGSALATFHERIRPRVEGAGFELDWQVDAPDDLPDASPRTALQVFRILQEAVANAIRHSGGDRVALKVQAQADGALVLSVADNGTSTAPRGKAGRGLANMRGRAALIGGRIDLDEGAQGFTVRLTLPAALPEAGS
jgi:signal transduction histidine kinase